MKRDSSRTRGRRMLRRRQCGASRRSTPPTRSRRATCARATTSRSASSRRTRRRRLHEKLLDQQVRDIEIGKAHIGIGMVHRGKLDAPAKDSVAEHDLVSEVYHIIDGTATLVLGPDITNRQRRPATQQTVREFNGPGNNGSEIEERRRLPAQAGRRRRDPGGHRSLVHEDRRSHRLSDGADRPGQGHADQRRGGVEGVPVEAGPAIVRGASTPNFQFPTPN